MIETLVTLYFVLGIFVTAFCMWVRFKGDWSQLSEISNIHTTIVLYFSWGWVVPVTAYKVIRALREQPVKDEKKD